MPTTKNKDQRTASKSHADKDRRMTAMRTSRSSASAKERRNDREMNENDR